MAGCQGVCRPPGIEPVRLEAVRAGGSIAGVADGGGRACCHPEAGNVRPSVAEQAGAGDFPATADPLVGPVDRAIARDLGGLPQAGIFAPGDAEGVAKWLEVAGPGRPITVRDPAAARTAGLAEWVQMIAGG